MNASFSIAGRPIGPGQPTYLWPSFRPTITRISMPRWRWSEPPKKRAPMPSSCKPIRPTPSRCALTNRISVSAAAPCGMARTLYDLYGEAFTPWDWQPALKAVADDLGIALFSSAFDPTAVEFLEAMAVPATKLPRPRSPTSR